MSQSNHLTAAGIINIGLMMSQSLTTCSFKEFSELNMELSYSHRVIQSWLERLLYLSMISI